MNPILVRHARAKLALHYSLALCAVALVVVGGLYVALSRGLQPDPTRTETVVDSTPTAPGEQRQEVTTSVYTDVEQLVAQHTLESLRSASVAALGGLFSASLLISWVIAGRVLRPVGAAMETQRRFVQDASHELRNPLAVMRTTLDLAIESPSTTAAEWRTAGTSLSEATNRMAAVVENLLRTARDELPQAHITLFDPGTVIHRVRAQVEPAAAGRGITLQVATKPGTIAGDPAALERAIANLVDNAVRHTPDNSIVAIDGRPTESHYEIRVDDRGSGIASHQVATIFERGHRSPTSPGLGLGLAIARDIVRGHGGHVGVERCGPPGATFLITIPLPTTRHTPDATATPDRTDDSNTHQGPAPQHAMVGGEP